MDHFERVAKQGDVPGLNQLVRAIDGPLGLNDDRPLRDPAAALGLAEVADPQVAGPPAGR